MSQPILSHNLKIVFLEKIALSLDYASIYVVEDSFYIMHPVCSWVREETGCVLQAYCAGERSPLP
jgi:hypothetical protein